MPPSSTKISVPSMISPPMSRLMGLASRLRTAIRTSRTTRAITTREPLSPARLDRQLQLVRHRVLRRLAAHHLAVGDAHHRVRVAHHPVIVRREEEGDLPLLVELDHQVEDRAAVSESRLAVGSSARTRSGRVTSARAMATRWRWPPESLSGAVLGRSRQPDLLERLRRRARAAPPRGACSGASSGSSTFWKHVEHRHQVEGLEDEADGVEPQVRQLALGEVRGVLARDLDHAPGRRCRRSRSRLSSVVLPEPDGPAMRDELALVHRQAHAAQRLHDRGSEAVLLDDVADGDDGAHGQHWYRSGRAAA